MNKKSLLKYLFFVIITIILVNIFFRSGIYVTIDYSNTSYISSAQSVVYYDIGKGFNETDKIGTPINHNTAKFKIKDFNKIKKLRIDPVNINSQININEITFQSDKNIIKINKDNFQDAFSDNDLINIENLSLDKYISFTSINNDPIMIISDNMLQEIKSTLNTTSFNIKSVLIKSVLVILFYILLYIIYIKKEVVARYINKIIIKIMLLIALAYIVIIAVVSPFNTHPDEIVTKVAIEYYESNYIIPDMRDLSHDKFSGYGQTRLSELTIYYLIAGKISALIPHEKSYRFFNVLLAFIIVFIIIKNYKQSPCLLFAFFITPQIWYIFSYATSDAFDYFLCFLLIYQLSVKNSLFNNLLNNKVTSNKLYIYACIYMSILIGLILMGKPNYFIILLLMAYILLKNLFLESENKSDKIRKIKIYTTLAVISCTIFLIRYSVDFYYYGFNKNDIFMDMRILHAIPLGNPATAYEEMYKYMFLAAKGVPLVDFFIEYSFFKTLINSFLGVYGYMNKYAHTTYYVAIKFFYLCFFCAIYYYIIKSKDIKKYLDGGVTLILSILSVGLVVYYSYFIDYQPQGRYILPLLLVIVYLMSNCKDLLYNRYMVAIILGMGILSHIYVLTTGFKCL